MPEIVKAKVYDASFFKSNVKSFVELVERLSVIMSKNQPVVKFFLRFFLPIARSYEKPIRHGDFARLEVLGLLDLDAAPGEIYVLPPEVQNLSPAHDNTLFLAY